MQVRKTVTGWRWTLKRMVPELYMLWCALILPTLRDYNWAEYGEYMIINALNFPSSFLLGWINYSAAIAVASSMAGLILLGWILACICIWLHSRESVSYRHQLRKAVEICSILAKFFYVTFLYVLMGFFDCSMDDFIEFTTNNVLYRYKDTACIGKYNVFTL